MPDDSDRSGDRHGPAGPGDRGGRPPSAGAPAFAARDRRTGRVLAWADGQWSGDAGAVAVARGVCWARPILEVTPHGPRVLVDDKDPVAALAVMRAVLGGNLELTGRVPQLRPGPTRNA